MELMPIVSFVVRFQLAGEEQGMGKKQWRIKVTHVQNEQEFLFESFEEAMAYIGEVVENS